MVVMAREAGMIGEVFRGVDASEGVEISNEVGLVEVATIKGNFGPVDGASIGDAPQDGLEASDAAEEFGGHADVLLEKFDEPARAEAGLRDEFGDAAGLRGTKEIGDGVLDHRLLVEHSGSALEEKEFDGAKLLRRRRRFEEAFAQLPGGVPPNIFQINVLVANFIARKFEERYRAGWTKRNADDLGLFVGIDGEGFGARAG
jgi:hypothetical protein